MDFTTPTNKTQMYIVLKELFNYYRIKKDPFEEVLLEPLNIERMEYSRPSDTELMLRANKFVDVENKKEIMERKRQINQEINECSASLLSLEQNYQTEKAEVESIYEQSYEKIRQTAIKNGLINTSAYLDKITICETEKAEKITLLTQEKNRKSTELNAKITALNQSLSAIEDEYYAIQSARVTAKVEELKDARDVIEREVFTYNNGVEEREQKHASTLIRANANLKLKYMEITMGEYSKDELVDMGYYDDVVECVTAYYDTLDPIVAYNDMKKESKLTIYLDDYYQNVVYMYATRAGVFE